MGGLARDAKLAGEGRDGFAGCHRSGEIRCLGLGQCGFSTAVDASDLCQGDAFALAFPDQRRSNSA